MTCSRFNHGGVAWLAIAAALCASCMHATTGGPSDTAPRPDSVTVALWHMDDPGGTLVADSGPLHIDATAGLDTRTDFGRFRSARSFARSIDSFIHAPYTQALETPLGITVDAWIQPLSFGFYEITPIAARWTERVNEKSWLFAVVGLVATQLSVADLGPMYFRELAALGTRGHLVFAIQPEEASPPFAYFSSAQIELKRWTHVAATYDGEVVRLYIDGRLDSQHELHGRIRTSRAPLLVGNYFDTRFLTDFGGTLRVGTGVDRNPFYAFEGLIDELRISSVARSDFPSTRWR